MKHNLSHIFPSDYPNLPNERDLQFEVQDLLRHTDSPMDIIHSINEIECPYHRKAIATLIPYHWHLMEKNGQEPAVYLDSEGDWRITWINIDYDMRIIIRQANAEQIELEHANDTILHHPTPTNTNPQHNNTTMPLIIKGDPQVINHYEGAHYENCTFYTNPPIEQPVENIYTQAIEQADHLTPLPITTDPAPLIFKNNEPNRQTVETMLKETLSSSNKKSVVCRKLYQQRELYNLHTQDDTTKAIIINRWVKRFGLERNFKADFSRKDFGNYYCKA